MGVHPEHHRRGWGRSPHGERGLKWIRIPAHDTQDWLSLPTRGAWIEMTKPSSPSILEKVAPHTGSVD